MSVMDWVRLGFCVIEDVLLICLIVILIRLERLRRRRR